MPDDAVVAITSPANPTVKDAVALRRRRHRSATGRFLVEGARETLRAMAAGVEIERLFVAPALGPPDEPIAAATSGRIPVVTVSEKVFAKLSGREGPDGILAVAVAFPTELGTIATTDLVLVAEGIEKPGNLGAMLRTAEAAGAAVVVADGVVDPFNPNVVRASQGSLFAVPLATARTDDTIRWLDGTTVVVATPEATTDYWDVDMRGPTAVVVGSEHEGVSERWKTLGTTVRIPMAGTGDSLNASIAAALVLYEAVRQRRITPGPVS